MRKVHKTTNSTTHTLCLENWTSKYPKYTSSNDEKVTCKRCLKIMEKK